MAASEPARTAPAAGAGERLAKERAPVRRDQGHKFLRDGRRLVCRKCGKESKTLDLVIACFDGHPAQAPKAAPGPKPTAVAAPAPKAAAPTPASPTVAAPAPAAAASGDDSHKFFRDGARYVCRSCQKKFFTRDDVGKCFDAHAAA
jgi:hypothetical protein